MTISYALRSKFMALCQKRIMAQQEPLTAGQAIQIALAAEEKGYPGKTAVGIEEDSLTAFETDWSIGDPIRFPARIKAAATALRDCGRWGSFDIACADGILSISKTS